MIIRLEPQTIKCDDLNSSLDCLTYLKKNTWNLSVSLSMQDKRSPVVNGQMAVPASPPQYSADP